MAFHYNSNPMTIKTACRVVLALHLGFVQVAPFAGAMAISDRAQQASASDAPASKKTCEWQVSSVAALAKGENLYGSNGLSFTVDTFTMEDAKIKLLQKTMLDGRLYTELGIANLRNRFHNPMLDPAAILAEQRAIIYIADHWDEFAELRAHLEQLREQEIEIMHHLDKLKVTDAGLRMEYLYAAMTYGFMLLPQIAKNFFEAVAIWVQVLFGTYGTALGYINSIRRAIPVREDLLRYRDYMLTASLAQDAFSQMPPNELYDLRQQLQSIFVGNELGPVKRGWIGLNAFLNHEDKDLLRRDVINGHRNGRFRTPLGDINLALRLLQKNWSIGILGGKFRLPVSDITTKSDTLHISNFWLRRVSQMIVNQRDQLAALFSAIGEAEFLIAAAGLYRDYRDKTDVTFLTPTFDNIPGHIYVEDMKNPLMVATVGPENVVPNDFILGFPQDRPGQNALTVAVSKPGTGVSTHAEGGAQTLAMAMAGLFVFGKSGSFTPGRYVVALDPTDRERESQRWKIIEDYAKKGPITYAFVYDPFSHAGEDAALCMRVASIVCLMGRPDVLGLMAMRDRRALRLISNLPDIRLIQFNGKTRKVEPYDPDVHEDSLSPTEYFDSLLREGYDPTQIELARKVYETLPKRPPMSMVMREILQILGAQPSTMPIKPPPGPLPQPIRQQYEDYVSGK